MTNDEIRSLAKENAKTILEKEKDNAKNEINEVLIDLFLSNSNHDFIILGYQAMNNEIDLTLFYANALAKDIPLYFPRTYDRTIEFFRVETLLEFKKGRFGILEPISKDSLDDDLLKQNLTIADAKILALVPGVAFSKDGYRIGHGMGYYDKFLAQCDNTFKIGITYSRLIYEFSREEWDIPMDMVLTENELIDARNRG